MVEAVTSGRRVWIVNWERDGGAVPVFVASSRKRAFEWARANFRPEREPPSERNLLYIQPRYVDREPTGRGLITARRDANGDIVFRDWSKDAEVHR